MNKYSVCLALPEAFLYRKQAVLILFHYKSLLNVRCIPRKLANGMQLVTSKLFTTPSHEEQTSDFLHIARRCKINQETKHSRIKSYEPFKLIIK